MKKNSSSKYFWILLCIILILILISLFTWNHTLNKVIFCCVSAVYPFISLHKFNIIVLKNKDKQLLISGCWSYATCLCFLGYIALLFEEFLG